MPAHVGDDALEKFLSKGVPQKEARTYALSGCVTPGVYGVWSRGGVAYVNLLKASELALNNGADPLTGIKAGPETGNAEEFESMDDIINAFKKQLESLIKRSAIACNILDKVKYKLKRCPIYFYQFLFVDV
jgi:formate C-acetyltransferase